MTFQLKFLIRFSFHLITLQHSKHFTSLEKTWNKAEDNLEEKGSALEFFPYCLLVICYISHQ